MVNGSQAPGPLALRLAMLTWTVKSVLEVGNVYSISPPSVESRAFTASTILRALIP